jgi:glycine cleavage system H protein
MVPKELKYTKEHEWVRIEGKEAVIGITDHAQAELGDITFVEVPKAGGQLRQMQAFGTIESVKAASDLYAPLTGKVIAVNPALEKTPEVVNQSPYEQGWLVRVEVANAAEASSLLDAGQYESLIAEEGSKG